MDFSTDFDSREMRSRLDSLESTRLAAGACPSIAAVRRNPDPRLETDHRQNFQIDADRILHSLAYTRYIDKTQVFYLVRNDHITHRVLHVQLVSKIARTIGRLQGLNEDLIEAIALGHDLGHAPFGHDGEIWLTAISRRHGLPPYVHALQSVRALDRLEKNGQGLNLSLQVLDGIAAHDGEADLTSLGPVRDKDFAALDEEIAAKEADPKRSLLPMTLEGCVVRLADVIAYIGRDFEDAIRLGLIDRDELPDPAADRLGRTNGTIVYRLVEDLLRTSLAYREQGRDIIGFSEPMAEALLAFKKFNYERIYRNPKIKVHAAKIERLFDLLFERYLDQLAGEDRRSELWTEYLDHMGQDYPSQPAALIVRDYIAGMTDDYFMAQAKKMLLPGEFKP